MATPKEVWLVERVTGEHEDYRETVIGAFSTEAGARLVAKTLNG